MFMVGSAKSSVLRAWFNAGNMAALPNQHKNIHQFRLPLTRHDQRQCFSYLFLTFCEIFQEEILRIASIIKAPVLVFCRP